MRRRDLLAGSALSRNGRFRAAVSVCSIASALLLASGCASVRHRISGEEAREAREFFTAAAVFPFPFTASYSGVAETSGRVLPFVAGVRSRSAAEETVGFYDPMGRPVLFLANDGAMVTVSRGEAGGEFPPPGMKPFPSGPVSLGRILAGAPGYTVEEGEVYGTPEGGWVFRNRRQRLFSDPPRRLIVRAEYDFAGKRVVVSYPEREMTGPPPLVRIEASGAKILMRRDVE